MLEKLQVYATQMTTIIAEAETPKTPLLSVNKVVSVNGCAQIGIN